MSLRIFPGLFGAKRAVRRSSRSERLNRLLQHPAVEGLELRIALTTDVWTGAAALAHQDYSWSNASNWSQGAPTSGEALQFPAASANNFIPTQPINNDLTGLTFPSIEIDSSGYSLTGNSISLTAATGISTTYTSGTSTISLNTTLAGSGSTITVAAGGELDLNGVVSDSSGLTLSGGGIVGGTGTLPALAAQNVEISPGLAGVGTMTVDGTATLAQATTFSASLNGQRENSSLFVNNTTTPSVNLNLPTLVVSLASGFTPAPGVSFTIIQGNIQGSFSGLSEGSTFTADGSTFTITYDHGVVLTAAKATSTTQTSGPSESVFGQSVTFSATVAGVGGTPTGSVTFEDGGSVLGTTSLNGSGVATFTTSDLPAGANSITAVYAGNSAFAGSTSPAFNSTVNAAATTTTVSSTANPSVVGQVVTLIADVAAVAPSTATPTDGTVSFLDGSTVIGTGTLDAGVASFTTSALALGQHSISAVYGGNTEFSTDTSSPITQVVDQSNTGTTLVSSANPGVFGQTLTFTAQVTATAPGGGTPTGSIAFMDGSTILATQPMTAGVATFSTSTLALGAHSITAVYGGDSNYITSTSTAVDQEINQASTTTALTSSIESSFLGESVTFTAQVVTTLPGTGTPTGSVTFMDGGTELGSAELNAGIADLATLALTLGTHSITAVYAGDTDFIASTSSPIQQLVGATTTTLASATNPSEFGQSVTFTATVAAVAAGGPTATGSVTFMDGTTVLGTSSLNNSGVATLATTSLSGGTHSITADYQGDSASLASTSNAVSQVVNLAATSTTVTASVNPSVVGQTVVLTADVTAAAGTPTGSVTFTDGGTVLGTTSVGASGTATLSTTALAVGSNTVVAAYSGSAAYSSSQSSNLSLTVNPAVTSTSLASSTSTPGVGQPVTFTATVSAVAPGAGVPTGMVVFDEGSTAIGTSELSGGQAKLTFAFNLVGSSQVITAKYLGSGSFVASASAGQTENVVQAAPAITLIATPLFKGASARRAIFQVIVQAGSSGAPIPSGTVIFQSNGRKLRARSLAGGTVAISVAKGQAVGRTFAVKYRGDADYTAGSSNRIRIRPSFFRRPFATAHP
jgi:Bacterial Ig-like domain (group 3)